ncbi:hypothetical protein E1B28_004824 [Marasmius oreades]|uniref:NADH dehydrogenase [ubiquinone] 1 alpha subcomplex assembly factor 3 n=1 Tax=Marasmius oreades TaxID=181124 RepID=A0A9P8ADD4_9AGAR|nr:uncharacterized protein E1B28_004824 [Marasmius oreades]KAG7097482.1 hypothetical protein E1B28_004824 [Marasmius oreades]
MQTRRNVQSILRQFSNTFSIRGPPIYRTVTITARPIHTTLIRQNGPRKNPLINILEGDVPPPVQVNSITDQGIKLTDGLVIPSSCIFLEGKVYLWDVPMSFWDGWEKDHFEVFELVVPRPEILLFGTGETLAQPPPVIRNHLNKLGIQLDVMDTRNACSTYNLLAEEGRRVAAALIPLRHRPWSKTQTPKK